jgi:hypothetical protein
MITSSLSAAQSFDQLSRGDQLLIRKSRKNALKAGVPMCKEWMDGDGILTAIQCIYRDIGKRPTNSHRLSRKDKTKEHSASNSFWSYPGHSTGRPSTELILSNGYQISITKASELAGLTPDAIKYRLKTMTIEQAMLSAKGCRIEYPKDKALSFFANIDMESCSSSLVQDEQNRHARQVGSSLPLKRKRLKDRSYDSLTVLSNNNLMGKLTQILALDLKPHQKTSLLAFMACPSEIRKGTHSVLKNIIRRCRDQSDANYSHYGARGIDVCETWVTGAGELSGLHCFVLDVGPQQAATELDRIDNDLGYSKQNCRWVTRKQNIRNTFRAEDIAARLNAMVEQRLAEELANR